MKNETEDQRDHLIAAGLEALILSPNSAAYAEREASYWGLNARLQPSHILQPRTVSDVSQILKAIATSPGKFAIRSGGHSQWAGGSNIHDGVTIDLGLMTGITYSTKTNLALIAPGERWGDVYKTLGAHGVCVAGGRVAEVGVAGFLTGGGMSFYNGRMGMACDSVVNFEVVVASGEVVNANKSENPDLWKALKGGSGNFGIVTRFDVQTFPATPTWGGVLMSPRNAGDQIIQEFVSFGNKIEKNPEDSMICLFTHNPSMFSDVVVATVIVNTVGVADAAAFEEIQKVPTLVQDLKTRSIEEMVALYVEPGGERNVWFTLTFRNDPKILKKAAELHDHLVADLKTEIPAQELMTQCLFQPLPTHFARFSENHGGNVLGLNSVQDNAVLWLGTAAVKEAEHEKIIQKKMASFAATLEDFAEKSSGNIPWRYLNYADPSQEPLSSLGVRNLNLLREASAKHDPQGLFQKKVTSGFKIPNSQSP